MNRFLEAVRLYAEFVNVAHCAEAGNPIRELSGETEVVVQTTSAERSTRNDFACKEIGITWTAPSLDLPSCRACIGCIRHR